MSAKKNITILIAPLDWGLGHATRCIPIINYFLKLQCNIVIATNGKQENLLKTEFPTLRFVNLSGYNVKYTSYKRFFLLKIIIQIPKILKIIRYENTWLSHFVANNPIDLIISDNRYGFFHKSVPSVFLTHQLMIKANNAFTEFILQKINYKYIKQFKACWVPDNGGTTNLAGKLSHPSILPKVPVVYLGGLSRFNRDGKQSMVYKLLIVLSGPEPQRTLLEKKLLVQLEHFSEPVLFVRGLPGNVEQLVNRNHIIFHNHLSAHDLEKAFQQSEYIISRSGYTTVMDICKLKKKSILIPTPGQTEQEYLSNYLQQKMFCISTQQDDLNLLEILKKAEKFDFQHFDMDMEGYKVVLSNLVDSFTKQFQ